MYKSRVNVGEYFCCTEIEESMEDLKEDDVLQDSAGSSPPSCLTRVILFHSNKYRYTDFKCKINDEGHILVKNKFS